MTVEDCIPTGVIDDQLEKRSAEHQVKLFTPNVIPQFRGCLHCLESGLVVSLAAHGFYCYYATVLVHNASWRISEPITPTNKPTLHRMYKI